MLLRPHYRNAYPKGIICVFYYNLEQCCTVALYWQFQPYKKFNNAIGHLSRHGFRRYFYISSDNSKHFKRNRLTLVIPTFDGCDTKYWTTTNFVYPTCRLVTWDVNMVKSRNVIMIAEEIINLLGLEGTAYLRGGTTDIATYALKETCVTFNNVM